MVEQDNSSSRDLHAIFRSRNRGSFAGELVFGDSDLSEHGLSCLRSLAIVEKYSGKSSTDPATFEFQYSGLWEFPHVLNIPDPAELALIEIGKLETFLNQTDDPRPPFRMGIFLQEIEDHEVLGRKLSHIDLVHLLKREVPIGRILERQTDEVTSENENMDGVQSLDPENIKNLPLTNGVHESLPFTPVNGGTS